MWSILSKGRRIFFSPNKNLVDYNLKIFLGSTLKFYKLDISDNITTTSTTTTTTIAPITSNRILYWDFSDPLSYTDTETVFDLENNSSGVIMNSPLSGNTGCGTYIDFNGTSQYIYTDTNLSTLFTGVSPNKSEVTSIFMWIYPKGDGVILSEVGSANSLSGWHTSIIEMVSGTLKFRLWDGTSNSIVTSSIPTLLNNWYYVGMTYDGSTLTAYVDGVSAGTVTFNRLAPYNSMSGLFYLLAHQDETNMGNGGFGNYRLGSLEIYTTSLSSTEINQNYNNKSGNYICETTTTTTTLPPPTQLLLNPSFDNGTNNWTSSRGFTTYSYTSANQPAVLNSILYFSYVNTTVSQSVIVSDIISDINTFTAVVNIKHREKGDDTTYTQADQYSFEVLFINSSGTTVISKRTPSSGQQNAPQYFTDVTLTLNRSEIPETFNNITRVQVNISGIDSGFWNGNHGPMVDYVTLTIN